MISLNLKRIIAKKPRILNLFQIGRGWAPFPLFYLVHLTLACNANCEFCYQKTGEWLGFSKDFLSADDFEKILKQAKSFIFKRPLIHFFGGEPLLHPRFPDFLDLAVKYRFPCALTTNGILLGKYSDKIVACGNLSQINISLYGVGEVHEKILGRSGIFDDVISNIKRLQELSPRKKVINVNCVISGENCGKLADFVGFLGRYFRKKEIESLVFQYPMREEIRREVNAAVLKSESEKIKKMKSGFAIYFVSEKWFNSYRRPSENCHCEESRPFGVSPKGRDDEAISENSLNTRLPRRLRRLAMTKTRFSNGLPGYFKGNCNLPWLGLGILPNLDVLPGGSVLTCARSIGNLKQNSLKEIWNGKELRDFRKQILRQGLPFSCLGCCHGQIFS